MINARQIAELLKRLDWKQVDLAKYCDVTQATVSRWLSGSLPDPPAQAKLQKLFNETYGEQPAAPGLASSEIELAALLSAVEGSYHMLGLDHDQATALLRIVLEAAAEPPTPSSGPDYHRVLAETEARRFLKSKDFRQDGA